MIDNLEVVGFKATFPSINYIFRDGQPAAFIGGKFATQNPMQILELRAEIQRGQPHISEMTQEEMRVNVMPGGNLMAGLKAKFYEEFQAELKAREAGIIKPASQYIPAPLFPASSVDVAVAASGGSGVSLAEQLLKLKLPEQITEVNSPHLLEANARVPQPKVESPAPTSISELERLALTAGRNQG